MNPLAPPPLRANSPEGWVQAWPDLVAFVIGLGAAWFFQWETRDLVWSLWLSSLVIGYAMIVWGIFGPGIFLASRVRGADISLATPGQWAGAIGGGGVLFVLGLFMLAFFTVHFGLFHLVHSVFLNAFFPIDPAVRHAGLPLNKALYAEVFRRYWVFLPAAALAERQAFRLAPREPGPPDLSVKAADIAARKNRNAMTAFGGSAMTAPYRNVMRMHLLIFFFAATHYLGLDNFAVYAVVSAVYFFPWRLLRRTTG